MPCITENFCRQQRNETLADVPQHGDGARQVRFTHILNPYQTRNAQEQALQQLTFETIRIAARSVTPDIRVRCVCVTSSADRGVVPLDFIAAESLTRTVLDVATFTVAKPLPLVFDIFDCGVAVPEDPPAMPDCEDFIIFSNMDIHLQPHFYLAIAKFIRAGYDVVDVHRRTIPHHPARVDLLPLMFAEIGTHHGGLDCIVFPRKKYRTFIRNNACVGMSQVMRAVLLNCAMQAQRYLMLDNSRLTFHLGNDRAWDVPLFDEYTKFNVAQFRMTLAAMVTRESSANKLISTLKTLNLPQYLAEVGEKASGSLSPKLRIYALICKLRRLPDRIRRSVIYWLLRPGEEVGHNYH
jgi:hypothetical protein